MKMAERFIGMTVALTLSNNSQLKGTVSKVDSTTQILHLHEGTYCFIGVEKQMLSLVTFLPSGAMIPEYSIEASHISSLEIVPSGPAQVEPPSITLPAPAPAPAQAQEFHDPAILSVSSLRLQVLTRTVQSKAIFFETSFTTRALPSNTISKAPSATNDASTDNDPNSLPTKIISCR